MTALDKIRQAKAAGIKLSDAEEAVLEIADKLLGAKAPASRVPISKIPTDPTDR